MEKVFLSLGLIGSAISVAGNFPMLLHLLKVKDSTGQSLNAWWTWQVANVLLLTYAIYIKDFVFTLLQIMWVIFVSVTIFLIIKYRKKANNEVTA
jgi:uncharacterized protein with PQ loop repeat